MSNQVKVKEELKVAEEEKIKEDLGLIDEVGLDNVDADLDQKADNVIDNLFGCRNFFKIDSRCFTYGFYCNAISYRNDGSCWLVEIYTKCCNV